MTGRMSSNDWSAMTGFVNIPHNDHQSTYEMMCEQYQKWAMATTVPHMTIKKHGGICEHLMLVEDEAFTNSAPRTPKALHFSLSLSTGWEYQFQGNSWPWERTYRCEVFWDDDILRLILHIR